MAEFLVLIHNWVAVLISFLQFINFLVVPLNGREIENNSKPS